MSGETSHEITANPTGTVIISKEEYEELKRSIVTLRQAVEAVPSMSADGIIVTLQKKLEEAVGFNVGGNKSLTGEKYVEKMRGSESTMKARIVSRRYGDMFFVLVFCRFIISVLQKDEDQRAPNPSMQGH